MVRIPEDTGSSEWKRVEGIRSRRFKANFLIIVGSEGDSLF
jgi:hypothetical protein